MTRVLTPSKQVADECALAWSAGSTLRIDPVDPEVRRLSSS
jgi:hypothetical protein